MEGMEDNVNSRSHLEKSTDSDAFESTKSQPDITMDKLGTNDVKLLRRETEPESLESVQKYARRIKSFLGWDANLGDEEPQNDKSERTVEDVAKEKDIGVDSEVKGYDAFETESDIESFSELPMKEEEDKDERIESGTDLNHSFQEKGDQNTERNDDENSSNQNNEHNDEQKSEHFRENDIGSDTELNILSVENKHNSELDGAISINEDTNKNRENLPIAQTDQKSTFQKNAMSESKNADITTPQIDGTNNTHENMNVCKENDCETEVTTANADSNSKIGASSEVKKLSESELLNSRDSISINFGEEEKTITTEPKNRSEEQQSQSISIEDQNSLKPLSALDFAKCIGNISIDASEPLDQTVKLNALMNYEITKDKISSISSSPSNELKDMLEDSQHNLENEAPPSCTKSLEEINSDIIERNVEADDTKSEDSICTLEDISSSSNINKPYLNKLRRLSQDIVKEVIESARSSVHELFINKDEELDRDIESTVPVIQNNLNVKQEPIIPKEMNFSELYSTLESESVNDENTAFKIKHFIRNEDTPTEKERHFQFMGNMDKVERSGSGTESECSTGDTTCGYGCFKPHCIQKYAKPSIFLAIFSIVGVIHSSNYSYMASVMSTMEKRYAFKTKTSGTIMSADDLAPLILGIFVGYIGGKRHRPRIIALGMLMAAASCFFLGLPYLIYGSAKQIGTSRFKNETEPDICVIDVKRATCNGDDLPPTVTVICMLLLGNFMKGFASVTYYVIGVSYMDDGIKKKNSPIYYAIALALRLLGPLLGFLMSSGFLKLYENPLHDPGYGPEDPRWIGAWWIGFFLQGILLIVFTLPIGLFPRRLPGRKSLAKATSFTSENSLKEIFVGLVAALKRLGKNPVFVLLIINTTMKIFGHFGHAIMLPKYMENQFRLSASEASLFSGATSITCIMLSTLLGGFLVWKFRPRLQVLLSGMIASEIIMCVGFLILMIPRCKTANMLHFGMDDEGLILNSVCNNKCDCSTTSFTPFCGQDGETMYFSPCYAGCTEKLTPMMSPKKHKEFGNCSCVGSTAQQNIKTTITEGFCPDENCWSQTLAYLIILFLVIAISNLFTVVHTMILLRSVHPNDKSVALGTFETFICLFGFIPFPVTYGALVDSACLVWEKSCGETGNCWFYDMERYRYLLHGASALFCSFSVVCLVLLYFFRSSVRDLYDDDDENEVTGYVDIKLDTVSGSVTKL